MGEITLTQMQMDQVFQKVFRRIYGKPCWNLKVGHGSFLTFDFGRPHLVVREPIRAGRNASPKVREHLARRHVYACGEWHLWIRSCDWEVRFEGRHIGDGSTKRKARCAAEFLDGQKLIQFSISPRKVQSTFVFDLGGVLKTSPYDKESEQWLLFEPSNKVLALRADAHYRYALSDKHIDKGEWKPI